MHNIGTAGVYRVGIVADTHGYLHPSLCAAFSDVDIILHAGDAGDVAILDALEAVAPVEAVFGNIDGRPIRVSRKEDVTINAAGVDIWMTHIGGRPGRWARGMRERLRDRAPNVFVCGHSHILQVERVNSPAPLLFINPGAAGRQGFHTVKTCLVLVIENGKPSSIDVIHLDQINP